MKGDRIVLDNSTVCRYRFRESNWSRVKPLIEAIQARDVVAYAPPHLLVEFFQVAHKKSTSLADVRRAVKAHYDWLTDLRIQYVEVDYVGDARELRLLVKRAQAPTTPSTSTSPASRASRSAPATEGSSLFKARSRA